MAISASGIGSGLDVDGLVSQLMALERRPLTTLATREAGVQAKISAFGTLSGAISGLQTAANNLDSAARFAATRTSIAGSNAGFTASSATGAPAASYDVQVVELARVQRVALSESAFASNGDAIAAGTLNLSFGTAAALAANDPASSVSLEFEGGSLQDLRKAINEAGLGVTASVVDDGNVDRLILSGKDSGAAQAFRIDGLGIAYSPDAPGAEGDPVFGLQAARDARINVDGLSITRSSNTVVDAIEGVTLVLNAETESSSKLTVAADSGGARSAIDAFVGAYNNAVRNIGNLTRYDAETREASVLTGDSTARAVQSQLRNIVGGVFEGLGGTSRLPELGIRFQLDGTLQVDRAELDKALADPERNVAAFFTGNADTAGFGRQVSGALGNLIGAGGLITGRTEGLKSTSQGFQDRAEALSRRLENVEARYRSQFAALDALIGQMTQTSNFLQQQLGSLPGVGSN